MYASFVVVSLTRKCLDEIDVKSTHNFLWNVCNLLNLLGKLPPAVVTCIVSFLQSLDFVAKASGREGPYTGLQVACRERDSWSNVVKFIGTSHPISLPWFSFLLVYPRVSTRRELFVRFHLQDAWSWSKPWHSSRKILLAHYIALYGRPWHVAKVWPSMVKSLTPHFMLDWSAHNSNIFC